MLLDSTHHLTYCTNIHPANTWKEVFEQLKNHVPVIKTAIAPNQPFAIGLYLSNTASQELLTNNHLFKFKNWLETQQLYVPTMNGFPFGDFHQTKLKDNVYKPDWTTNERVRYTTQLIEILKELLPKNKGGGISTLPISYKYWYKQDDTLDDIYKIASNNLVDIALILHKIYEETGKLIHLDIEPEPDCLLENSDEVVEFFNNWLLPIAEKKSKLFDLSVTNNLAEIIRRHIRICYDVCHFAVEFEEPETVLRKFEENNIQIGKIQISAALIAKFKGDKDLSIINELSKFDEQDFLHQTITKNSVGKLHHYRDLNLALSSKGKIHELRSHYHVPIFVKDFGLLSSTQEDIIKVLTLIQNQSITNMLEVETYTWDILPTDLKLGLNQSVIRELQWVQNNFIV